MEGLARQASGTQARQEPRAPVVWSLVRLARPMQWGKGIFVLIGPLYGLHDMARPWPEVVASALVAVMVFGFAASGCYVGNDILDATADRLHPRKRLRPVASGAITPRTASWFAVLLIVLAGASLMLLDEHGRMWTGLAVLLYVGNVWAYTLWLKRVVIADVICLSLGFVLRVVGGCVAVGIWPTTWLINCTFFLAMFLAFGKRLGERRTVGDDAAAVRAVQSAYTDELLRMAVVVTAVAALVTYAGYVQAQAPRYQAGFNLLWLTMLPATYGLLRCIVLLERGQYDDPTELAVSDRPFQAAAGLFGSLTVILTVTAGGSAG